MNDTTSADYHRATNYDRMSLSGGSLDWSNRPITHKPWHALSSMTLPPAVMPDSRLKDAVAPAPFGFKPTTAALSPLLRFALRPSPRPGTHGAHSFRSVPSAGALYPVEIHIALRGIEGLSDGIWHYDHRETSLALLRSGADPSGGPITIYLTSVLFRSAWKYRERALRYVLLDTGHVVESLSLASNVLGLPLELDPKADLAACDELLGLDRSRERCLAVLRGPQTVLPDPGLFAPLNDEQLMLLAEGSRCAPRDQPPAKLLAAMDSVCVPTTGTVDAKRLAPDITLPKFGLPDISLDAAIHARRSRRSYAPEPLPLAALAALARFLTRGITNAGMRVGIIADHVEDIPQGHYALGTKPDGDTGLSLRRDGRLGATIATACLEQSWLSRAAAHVILSLDPVAVIRSAGPAGYRLAGIAAGRMGQRAYLAASALDLACCGIGAFFDDEAAMALGLDPGERLLYLLAIGPTAMRED